MLLAVAAEGLLTLMDALIKELSPRYNVLEIAFLRYAFGMIGAVVYAAWKQPGWPTREAAAYNGLRAFLIVITATSFFFALGHLPRLLAISGLRSGASGPELVRLIEDSVPAVFLYHARGVQGVSRRVEGIRMDLRGELVTLTQWTVSGER